MCCGNTFWALWFKTTWVAFPASLHIHHQSIQHGSFSEVAPMSWILSLSLAKGMSKWINCFLFLNVSARMDTIHFYHAKFTSDSKSYAHI
jgi:hypothetical protein